MLAACARPAPAVRPPDNAIPPTPPADPFAPVALEGPFGSLEEFCATVDGPIADTDDQRRRCVPEPGGPAAGPTTLDRAPPFRRVVIFPTYDEGGVPLTECNLALDAGNGWYVAREVFECHRTHLNGEEDMRVASMEVQRFVGDHDLVVRLADDDGSVGFPRLRTFLLVCAIGASGVPSCTPTIPTVLWVDIEDRMVLDVRAEPGAIDIEIAAVPGALGEEDIPDEWQPLTGRHPLFFP